MKALLVIIMSLCIHVTYAQKPDTTKTFIQGKELGEVVVKSSYLTREDDHILAIPTKEQRKHAVTGYDLLSNLMIRECLLSVRLKVWQLPMGLRLSI